ncbi:MAG: aminotransferase class V-fold PLP-dependent enzyme [Acidobacteriota bacterium]
MPISRRDLFRLTAAAAAAGTAARGRTARAAATAAVQGPDPLGVRADFRVTGRLLHLDTAYIGPVPTAVADAGAAFCRSKATRPISLGDMQAKTDEVRRQVARLINASPDEVGFLAATSEGENLIANALALGAGDNVVIDELHYLAEFVLYKRLEQTRGVELRIARADDGAVTPAAFERLVDGRTRLVSVALVSNQNGWRHDLRALADLAHAHGAWLYTDAIQALGALAIDVRATGVDALCSGTYKWLHAGYGVAPFYVRREILDRVPPDRWGALHVERTHPGYRYDIYTTARKYEYATLAFGAVYQLGAALTYLDRVGVPRIEAYVTALAARLSRGLRERKLDVLTPAGTASPIVAFRNPADPAAARKVFQEAGVQVSFRENGTQVRVSPALFNVEADVDRFLDVAERLR